MDKKESNALAMNKMIEVVVSSSIIVLCDRFNILRDVNTTKHNPSKFDDALST
jgi:hypothetical protein